MIALALASVFVILSTADRSLSDSDAVALVKKCRSVEACFVHTSKDYAPGFALNANLVEKAGCTRTGDVRAQKREPYDGGEFIYLDCISEGKLVSRATIWSNHSTFATVDIVACPDNGECPNYFQPI